MTKHEAREVIQTRFKKAVDRNVAFLAYEQLLAEGHTAATEVCSQSHEVISERLWSEFAFEWSKVFFNPGGTSGRASTFLQTKAALSYEWSLAGGEFTETSHLEAKLLTDLNLLWLEWAGYSATSSPELEVAID